MESVRECDVIVIGAGAAGLFCAAEAGRRGRRVLVLEHSDRVGKKIRISGGGRCNFTNTHTTAENFLSANPHFCKSALARYTPAEFVALVVKHGIPYHEKKLGQLFCDGSSQQIIDMLLRECSDAGVEIRCGCQVIKVRKGDAFPTPARSAVTTRGVSTAGDAEERGGGRSDRSFSVETSHGSFASSSLVIATGGLSVAPLGASDFGYRIARQFGLRIEEPRPGLVALTLPPQNHKQLALLSGVSLDVLVSCRGQEFRENLLITHRGLSGPAILQISSYWKPGEPISINLLPNHDVLDILTGNDFGGSEIELANLLSRYLPRRFASAWCEIFAPSRPLKQYDRHELRDIAQKIHNLQLTPSGTEGFKKAEVTAGGVATTELSSQTMEAKRVSGLYFIGEVVDVTGQLGGHNFQWAWASGHAAGGFV